MVTARVHRGILRSRRREFIPEEGGSRHLNTWTYGYRADGMRTLRSSTASGQAKTYYRYDGQMGFEDMSIANTGGAVTKMHYGLGARGLDLMERVTSSATTTVFPLYDCHGNNVASLSRSGTSYALADQKVYDAWGRVRNTTPSGDPKARFCASIGHKTDDESDLIYMRARYYEPIRGRFISQDPARHGLNWYAYCGSNPVNFSDRTGTYHVTDYQDMFGFLFCVGMTSVISAWAFASLPGENGAATISCLTLACLSFGLALELTDIDNKTQFKLNLFTALTFGEGAVMLCAIAAGLKVGGKGVAGIATASMAAYSCMVLAALLTCNEDWG